MTSVWNFLKQKTEIFLCQMLTMINVWLNSVHIFINYHFHWISFLRSAFVRIHVLVIQRKECITLVNAAFYLLFVHTTRWMKVFFSHFISICFLHKFREVFLFYILQPCSGQTFSFSFELASAVFNSFIYFDNDLIIFKNFKFILLNFINITSRSYLVDQKLLFFFLYRFLFR